MQQVNCLFNEPGLHLKKNILRFTEYLNLGEEIKSREGIGTRLKERNEKHVQILLNTVDLRCQKFTGCQCHP